MVLVLLNGFFVAAEFAMVKVRGSRIETLVQEGQAQAKHAQQVVEHLDAYLSACQLGITLASLGLGWIGEPAVAQLIAPLLLEAGLSETAVHTVAFAIAFSIITALHIILGELAPKSLAIQKADRVTLWTAWPLIAFYKLMYPVIWGLNALSNGLLRLLGIRVVGEHEAAHTEEEIRILMEESHRQGFIDQTELTYVDNIFEFAERNVKEVMIPRTEMACLYLQDSFATHLETALAEQFTRYPVCDPDKDNIIGFVHSKDLLAALARGKEPALQSLVRKIHAVPESMPISTLLKLLQKNHSQIAIVIDEYGGTAGMVTVEDILEEIVGEIQDEFDEERPFIEKVEERQYSVDGGLLIEAVNESFGLELDSEDVDTIGGWMAARVELPPRVGQKILHAEHTFTVQEVDHLRVTRVEVCTPLRQEPVATEELL